MNKISVKGASCAVGTCGAVLYVGCVFIMLAAPKDVVVRFFNSILHGWDVSPIMRWDMPWWEAAIGTFEMFILGWLIGALLAVVYNVCISKHA